MKRMTSRTSKIAITATACSALVLLVVAVWAATPATSAQQKSAAVTTQTNNSVTLRLWRNQPVEVTGITVAGQDAKLGGQFTGAADWLKSTVINFKNTSSKPIAFVEFEVRPGQDARSSASATYGARPSLPGEPAPPISTPQLAPGGTASIALNERFHGTVQRLAENTGGGGINHIVVRLGTVYFTDNTAWKFGYMHHPDPNKPGTWLIDQPEDAASGRNKPLNRAGTQPVRFTPAALIASSKSKSAASCPRLTGFEQRFCFSLDPCRFYWERCKVESALFSSTGVGGDVKPGYDLKSCAGWCGICYDDWGRDELQFVTTVEACTTDV